MATKTYKELLAEIRAANPDMSFRDAQQEASRLSKFSKEPESSTEPEPPIEPPPESKKVKKTPEPEPEVKKAPVKELKIQEPVLDATAKLRCASIEAEIRARDVTMKRIKHIIDGSGASGLSINRLGNQVIITGAGIRIPLKGHFLVPE